MNPNLLPFDPRKLPDPRGLHIPLDQAMEGWRAWVVDRELPRFGNSPKLYSASGAGRTSDGKPYYWTPRRTALAECRYDCEPMEIPKESCSCGFYSAKTLDQLLDELGYARYDADEEEAQIRVLGTVANWGKVIEGSQGWRASKSYPTQLWVPYEAAHLANPLKQAYGCKVGLKNFVQDPFERKAD